MAGNAYNYLSISRMSVIVTLRGGQRDETPE